MLAQYHFPTHTTFGPGAINELPALLRGYGAKKPVVVTDKGLAKLSVTSDLMAQLKEAGFDALLFDGIEGNPLGNQVRAGAEAAKGHGADAVVAFGGGASLDSAKLVALMVHHPGDLFDYDCNRDDMRPIDQPIPPNLCDSHDRWHRKRSGACGGRFR